MQSLKRIRGRVWHFFVREGKVVENTSRVDSLVMEVHEPTQRTTMLSVKNIYKEEFKLMN